jgi:hypothetical protein
MRSSLFFSILSIIAITFAACAHDRLQVHHNEQCGCVTLIRDQTNIVLEQLGIINHCTELLNSASNASDENTLIKKIEMADESMCNALDEILLLSKYHPSAGEKAVERLWSEGAWDGACAFAMRRLEEQINSLSVQ